MTIKELKEFILKNNKIGCVLEAIGCHHVKHHPDKGYWSCGNIDGDNVGAINVYEDENLLVHNWTREKEFSGVTDIITLTQYNKKCSFVDAVKFLCDTLGLDFNLNKAPEQKKPKFNPLAIFENAISMKSRVNVGDIHAMDESVLDEYVSMLHIDWFREGIMPWTRKKFGICYSYKYNRVVIPHRYWLTGELVGTNMRTTISNYDELGISKYFLTPGMNKAINLYGLYENYNSIQEKGYVVVTESEKSVLKRDSLNDSTCVALSGHTISDEQVNILIGLNVEIIIMLDKDICEEEVWNMCEKFYHIRLVSYIYDKRNLLKSKESPADAKNKIYESLFNCRITYGDEEHKKYLKSLEK